MDEYDTPMLEAYTGGYWKDLIAFTRSLFNATFKNNPYLERAIMTGITRQVKNLSFRFEQPKGDNNHISGICRLLWIYGKGSFTALEEYGLGIGRRM